MDEKIRDLRERARAAIAETAQSLGELNDIRVKFLGKKGEMTALLRSMSALAQEERPRIGKIVNEARAELEELLAAKSEELAQRELADKIAAEQIDVTLPGRTAPVGHLHPLTITLDRIKKIFLQMGFTIEEGPEIESDYYNFEALNLPKDHPARDMQDSFYITEDILLRSQTSPVQARTMQKNEPNAPIRMIAPGRVYRRDSYDATHSPMFTQVEGLVIDKGISFADLKGTLELCLHQLFDADAKVRFRPSFFPFTEPSCEVDVSCGVCGGVGCRFCKNTGWLEILGCGMVDPNVFGYVGIDSERYSGFAFGIGVERVAALRYDLPDLRMLMTGDMRFLGQF